MANVTIPYALIPAVAVDQRRTNVLSALARGLPRLQRQIVDDRKTLYIACFGPSLRETWPELRGKSPIIAMSGASKFLHANGITPDYVIEMDPRESQLVVSMPPVPGAHYLIASCVHPKWVDQVVAAGNPITLWHTVNTNWDDELQFIAQHDPDQLVVHAGSTVGLGSIHVGGILGFNRFIIHGMDGSFGKDGMRHAAYHGGKEQPAAIEWAANRVTYRTSKIMANAVAESINTAKNFPIVTIWHGDGLTQALIRKANLPNAACADELEKVTRLMGLRPQVVLTPKLTIGRSFWDALLDFLTPEDLPELVANIALCEPRRAQAKYNTGTVPWESAVYLRALSRFYEPEVVAEVGTFIGTSALALNPKRVIYTCDRSNNCVASVLTNEGPNLVAFPYRSSTEMLAEIQEPVDLFFFDGRVQLEDLPHLQRLMKPSTVVVLDDYVGKEKGVVNADLLAPYFPLHTLIQPQADSPSTLAALVPFMRTERKR